MSIPFHLAQIADAIPSKATQCSSRQYSRLAYLPSLQQRRHATIQTRARSQNTIRHAIPQRQFLLVARTLTSASTTASAFRTTTSSTKALARTENGDLDARPSVPGRRWLLFLSVEVVTTMGLLCSLAAGTWTARITSRCRT